MSGIIKVIPENVFTSLQFGENVIEVNNQRIDSCGKMKTPVSHFLLFFIVFLCVTLMKIDFAMFINISIIWKDRSFRNRENLQF